MRTADYKALSQDLTEIRNRLYLAEQKLQEAKQLVDQMAMAVQCLYEIDIKEKD